MNEKLGLHGREELEDEFEAARTVDELADIAATPSRAVRQSFPTEQGGAVVFVGDPPMAVWVAEGVPTARKPIQVVVSAVQTVEARPIIQREKPDEDAIIEDRAYRQAGRTPVGQIARELQELLSRRVTAWVAGAEAGRTVARWVNGEVAGIRPDNERRLRAAYQIVQLLGCE